MKPLEWRRKELILVVRFVAASLALVGFGISTSAYVSHRYFVPAQADEVNSTWLYVDSTRSLDTEPAPPKWIIEKLSAEIHTTISYDPYPLAKQRIGTITLPSLEQSWPIFEGTDDPELARGVGHYLNSVLPGESDHAVLAGHRETVFNRLGELKIGEKINISTSAGVFQYQIKKFRVVDRTDRTVIVPSSHAVLTLVTCYPINFVGTTHQTFVVTANLVASNRHHTQN